MSPACCTWKDCKKLARWRVGFKLWPLGRPKLATNCLVSRFQHYLVCDEHRAGVKVEDLLLPEGRDRIAAALRSLGKAPADFDSAELDFDDLLAEAPPLPGSSGRPH